MTQPATYHRGSQNYGTGYEMMARIDELEDKLAKAVEQGFWAGRSCGGSKKQIDAALAELTNE